MSLRSRIVEGFECPRHTNDPWTEGFCGQCLDDHIAGVIHTDDGPDIPPFDDTARPKRVGGWLARLQDPEGLPVYDTTNGNRAYVR